MPRQINFTFRGMKELQAQLNKIVVATAGDGRKAGEDLKEVLRDAADPIRADAVRNAPVDDGELKAAIFADRGDPNKPSAIVGVNLQQAPHAGPVEFGHAGPHPAPPHPYMRPAIEANRAKVRAVIAEGIGKIIKKYA